MPADQQHATTGAAADLDAAERALRDALARNAGDRGTIVSLANLLQHRGKAGEAEALLATAAESAPHHDLLHRLALIQYSRQALDACERTLDSLITIAPSQVDLPTYRLLAKLKGAAQRPDEARAVMARAVAAHPGATEFVAAYTDLLEPKERIAELEKHLRLVSADPGRVAYLLLRLTTCRAPEQREARGLPVDFGLSWADTLQWPDFESLPRLRDRLMAEIAGGSRRATARLDLAYIAVAEGAWDIAESYLGKLRSGPKRTPADFTAFGREFHATLDAMGDREISGELAPVQRIAAPPFQSGETIYVACDPKYFVRFALPFIAQFEAAAWAINLHVHILDGDSAQWAEAAAAIAGFSRVRVTLTAEASGAHGQGLAYARRYYHAVRYIRLFDELRQWRRPMWMLDADAQLLRDPRALLSSLNRYDVAFKSYPCCFEPVLKIDASCVGISPTPLGLEFARRVAAYIAYWKSRGTWEWGVDQLGLFSSYAHMSDQGREPATLFLNDTHVSRRSNLTGAIHFLPGIGKYAPAPATENASGPAQVQP